MLTDRTERRLKSFLTEHMLDAGCCESRRDSGSSWTSGWMNMRPAALDCIMSSILFGRGAERDSSCGNGNIEMKYHRDSEFEPRWYS